MVATAYAFALVGAIMALEAEADHHPKAVQAVADGLERREVTVTVTECPADNSTPMAAPGYTTAGLPPLELTPTVPAIASTASVIPPGGETGDTGGSTPIATSSYTPIAPIPVTPTTHGTAETIVTPQTSVYTATTTGIGTSVASSSVATRVTSAVTSHPVTGTSATDEPSPTPTTTSGAAKVVSVSFGLMVLVAMAALA